MPRDPVCLPSVMCHPHYDPQLKYTGIIIVLAGTTENSSPAQLEAWS